MRSSTNGLFNWTLAALASSALLFAAGTAGAGVSEEDEVPDNFYDISDPDDENVEGFLDAEDDDYFAFAFCQCENGTDIVFFSDHPDDVKGKKGKFSVGQGEKTNEANVDVDVQNLGPGLVDCDKASVEASVKIKGENKGKAEGQAKNCAGLSAEQVQTLVDDCSMSKNVKVKGKEDTIKKIKCKIKGDADVDD